MTSELTPEREAELVATINAASFDPGHYVKRGCVDHGDCWPGKEYEDLDRWRSRAVRAALHDSGFIVLHRGDVTVEKFWDHADKQRPVSRIVTPWQAVA